MICKLVKIPFTFTDSKKVERVSYHLALVFKNGDIVRIEPNSFTRKDSDGKEKTYSTKEKLSARASSVPSDGSLAYDLIDE